MPTGTVSKPKPPRPVEVGMVTKKANATSHIDYATPRSANSFTDGRTGPWVGKVRALVDGVIEGRGKFDEFYRIGRFTAPSGARTTIRNLSKQVEHLPKNPVTFEVEQIVLDDGTKGSELWAAVHRS